MTQNKSPQPLVTAIIPTYRRPGLVTRAIRSVLSQTVPDIEVIVVDDASPENTEKSVSAVGDSRVRYIRHSSNRGLPASRNTGIGAARGQFIAFLDDDDEWLPDKTEKQLRYLRQHRLDAVVGMCLVDGKIPFGKHNRLLLTPDDLRSGNRWGSCSLFAKADVVRAVLFDESLTFGEDWDFYIRLSRSYRLGCLNEPLFIYHQVGQDAAPQRMLSSAKDLSPEGLARVAMLRKHRSFFGEDRFRYLLAGTVLAYVGRRTNPLPYIKYALEHCGPIAVISVLGRRIAWHSWRFIWRIRRSLEPQIFTKS